MDLSRTVNSGDVTFNVDPNGVITNSGPVNHNTSPSQGNHRDCFSLRWWADRNSSTVTDAKKRSMDNKCMSVADVRRIWETPAEYKSRVVCKNLGNEPSGVDWEYQKREETGNCP